MFVSTRPMGTYRVIFAPLFFGLFFFLFASTSFGQGYSCKKCGPWKLSIFDIAVNVPKPVDSVALNDWTILKLFSPSFVQAISATEDRECLQWLNSTSSVVGSGSAAGQSLSAIEYMTEGSITGSFGGYTAQVLLRRASDRVIVKQATVTFAKGSDCVFQAGLLKSGLGGTIKDVIYNFEKPLRDDPRNNFAWNPGLGHFDGERGPGLTPEKYEYVVDTSELVEIKFEFLDCDEEPLRDRKILVSAHKSVKLPSTDAYTNSKGKGVAYCISPKDVGTYKVSLDYDCKRPSSAFTKANAEVTIKVRKPKNEFSGKLTVHTVRTEKQFNADHELTGTSEFDATYSADVILDFIKPKFKWLMEHPDKFDMCDGAGACPFLIGSSGIETTGTTEVENTPIQYYYTSVSRGLNDEHQMIDIYKGSGGGSISEYRATVIVAPITEAKASKAQPTGNMTPAALVKHPYHYQMYVTIGGLSRNFNPNAGSKKSEHYDIAAKEWITDESDGSGVSIADLAGNADLKLNIQELESFLKNPSAAHTFSTTSNAFEKSDTMEMEEKVWVTLTLK
jgi:hypothetical protein